MYLMTPNILKERNYGLTSISGSKSLLRVAIAFVAELDIKFAWILANNRAGILRLLE